MRWIQVCLVVGVLALAACGGGGSKGTGPVETYVISGLITGDVVERVPVALGGDASTLIETDSFGNFAFPPVPAGTYSVTPTLDSVTFAPVNRIVVISNFGAPGLTFTSSGTPQTPDEAPPTSPVRLVFAHPTDGTTWLNTNNGALGDALGANNYYVRDVSLGWGDVNNPNIGSQTDIGQWYTWFADTTPQGGATVRDNITAALYTTDSQVASFTPIANPGGDNEIVLIMSSFINSGVKDDNGQPPTALYGQPAASAAHTLPNCQDVYRQILEYFKTQPNKLFVVVTAAPLVSGAPQALLTEARNARDLNNWLVNTWLLQAGWEKKNVAVFDFFTVLTHVDNHHRVEAGVIEHITSNGDNFSDFASGPADSTPSQAGNVRGTAEFPALLNVAYNRWQTWLTAP